MWDYVWKTGQLDNHRVISSVKWQTVELGLFGKGGDQKIAFAANTVADEIGEDIEIGEISGVIAVFLS